MTKRILILMICLGLLLSVAGCKAKETPPAPETSPIVFTTQATEMPTVPTQAVQTQPTQAPTESVPTAPPTTPTTPPQTEPSKPTQPTEPPDPDTLWTPICQEYINLRATPGGNLIGTVPVNATVVLQKWVGKYAHVTYNGTQGYVTANYIKPASSDYLTKRLQTVTLTTVYTYDQMRTDMAALQALYPDKVTISSIGLSEMGREIPVLRMGDPNAKHHILLQGAIHAREHFTACLLMALADNYLSKGIPSDVCWHIIPMSNPDGVILAQSGTLNAAQTQIYERDLAMGYTTLSQTAYAQYWKANAMGVDLNRNFSSGWENSLEHKEASSEKYRGTDPFSAAESRALRDYTLQYDFAATFSFHSSGSVLYYQYGNKQPVNQQSYSLALATQAVTGYIPVSTDGTSGAGYKDWAMDALGIPSLTVEIGNDITPLEDRDLYNTFARCEGLFPAVETWLK